MYSSIKYKVKLSSGSTPVFSSNIAIGLKQGCNMSPSLFNVFINDIPELLNTSNCDPVHLGTTKVNCLLYADDLVLLLKSRHRIKISNRRATQRWNVSAFFYAKICSLLARRRSSQPVQRVYWPENVIDWLGKWRPTCVMRYARGQKLQSFRRKWPFYMDLYSMVSVRFTGESCETAKLCRKMKVRDQFKKV